MKVQLKMKNQVLTVLLAIAILFCQTMVVFVPIFTFLDAINYDIPGLVWDNVKYFFSDKINYDEYRSSFRVISKYVYQFLDEHPDFYSDFDGFFYITTYGIEFSYQETCPEYHCPDNVWYTWYITDPAWSKAIDYYDAIPRKQWATEQYWFVSSDIITCGTVYGYMVYSRNGKLPINYIKELRSEEREWYTRSYIVNIIKHLDGWYELRRK